jgi:chaperonin GroEL (HSP60 family)
VKSLDFENEKREIYQSIADSFEILPKLLIENTGENVSKILPSLKERITSEKINQENDPILEPFILKREIYQNALECCLSILKVDCVIQEKLQKRIIQ